MNVELDHPLTREATVCSLCRGAKAAGQLVCWPCWGEHNMRNGEEEDVTAHLATWEYNLENGWKPVVRGGSR